MEKRDPELHLYIVWEIWNDLNPRRSDALIARCLTCGRIVGCKDVGNKQFPNIAVPHYSQICLRQTTKTGIKKLLRLAKKEFGQQKINATEEKTNYPTDT